MFTEVPGELVSKDAFENIKHLKMLHLLEEKKQHKNTAAVTSSLKIQIFEIQASPICIYAKSTPLDQAAFLLISCLTYNPQAVIFHWWYI